MKALSKQIDSLKKKIKSLEIASDRSMIVFAIGNECDWDDSTESYSNQENTPIEAYSVPDNLKKFFDKAKSLNDLKSLGEKNNFEVFVLPCQYSIKDLWNDHKD